jgi:SAM-dependent methyltransferase
VNDAQPLPQTFAESVPFWERISTQTRYGRYLSDIEEAAIRGALDLAGAPATALDIGCEGGRWAGLLVQRGWRPICTEINARALEVCERRVPSAECILAASDATTLPCATRSVRLALCIEVRGVIEAPWFADEIARVIAPDGCFVGVFWNRWSSRALVRQLMWRVRGGKAASMEWYQQSYATWRADMQQRGFHFVRQIGYGWIPFGRESDSVLVAPAAAAERALGLRRLPDISPWIVFTARKRAVMR